MKWALAVIGIVVVLVLAVVAIGFMLPVAHTARRSAVIAAPPSAVWAAISDVVNYPSWRDDVEEVEMLAPVDGQQAWREKGSDGDITYAMTRVEPPTRMATRITDDELPFGGAWELEISPAGAGSRVSITERGEVYNPLFRFVSRFIMGHTATMDAYLRALGAKFGAPVVPETSGAT